MDKFSRILPKIRKASIYIFDIPDGDIFNKPVNTDGGCWAPELGSYYS